MFVEVVEENESPQEQDAAPASSEQPSEPFGFLGRMIMKHHLHPISVHTPNGVLPVGVVFLVAGALLGIVSLELAAWYNLIFVLLSMPVVVFTGVAAWQRKYNGAKTPVFITKMVCSATVGVLLGVLVFWRLIDAEVAMAGSTKSTVYIVMSLVALAAAGLAGHLGGKLVFGK